MIGWRKEASCGGLRSGFSEGWVLGEVQEEEMRGANSSVDTVNAAAVAVATSFERRVQQDTVPRRRWTAWFSDFLCFGSSKTDGRIRYASLAPEPARPTLDAPELENSNHQFSPSLPFVVPPSSPASFLQSGPPSSTLSPTGPLSFSTISASSYSPSGTASIFAIGPYAHETQLVSPPVFSTFTTEPSTASFTPPPESAHLTTPSSPEVPFAKFLTSSLNGNYKNDAYEFQSYQFYPGSPIGNLISPTSVCSGTSSPFRDAEFLSSGVTLSFPTSEPPKILSSEGIAERKLTLEHARNGKSLLDGQISAVVTLAGSSISSQSNGSVAASDQRGSIELNAEEFTCCLGIKPSLPGEGISEFPVSRNSGTQQTNESDVTYGISISMRPIMTCLERSSNLLPIPQLKSLNLIILMGLQEMLLLVLTGGLMRKLWQQLSIKGVGHSSL